MPKQKRVAKRTAERAANDPEGDNPAKQARTESTSSFDRIIRRLGLEEIDELLAEFPVFEGCCSEVLKQNKKEALDYYSIEKREGATFSNDSAEFKSFIDILKGIPVLAAEESPKVDYNLNVLFNTAYQNEGELIGTLFELLDKFVKAYGDISSKGFHSCYSSFIQGSMSGKSRRLVRGLKYTFGFYINFILNKDGYPERTDSIADWIVEKLKGSHSTETSAFAHAFYISCIRALSSWLNEHALAHKDARSAIDAWNIFQESEDFWPNICKEADVIKKSLPLELKTPTPSKATSTKHAKTLEDKYTIQDHVAKLNREARGLSVQLKLFWSHYTPCALSPKNLKLLFVFDEARQLAQAEPGSHSTFEILRFPLKEFFRENPFAFAVFTDTNSKLANFSPAFEKFDSSRDFGTRRIKLYPPIWSIPNLDVWPECHVLNRSFRTLSVPQYFSVFGRAALHNHIRAESPTFSLGNITTKDVDNGNLLAGLLNNKLGTGSVGISKEVDTALTAIASINFRVALTMSAGSVFSNDLVSSRMHLCCGVSNDRTMLFVRQAPEPMISVVAKNIISDFGWSSIFKHLADRVATFDVNVGSNGEGLAQLLMIMASDIVSDWSPFSAAFQPLIIPESVGVIKTLILPIPALDFLKQLLPSSALRFIDERAIGSDETVESLVDAESIDNLLQGYVMRLISFTRFEHEAAQRNAVLLEKLFNRATGMMLHTNAKAADAIIPIYKVESQPTIDAHGNVDYDGLATSILDERVQADRFSYISVQIKNYSQNPGMSAYRKWAKAMKHSVVFPGASFPDHPRIFLVIDVGHYEGDEPLLYRFEIPDEPQTIAIAVRGIRPSQIIASAADDVDGHYAKIRGHTQAFFHNAENIAMFKCQYGDEVILSNT